MLYQLMQAMHSFIPKIEVYYVYYKKSMINFLVLAFLSFLRNTDDFPYFLCVLNDTSLFSFRVNN